MPRWRCRRRPPAWLAAADDAERPQQGTPRAQPRCAEIFRVGAKAKRVTVCRRSRLSERPQICWRSGGRAHLRRRPDLLVVSSVDEVSGYTDCTDSMADECPGMQRASAWRAMQMRAVFKPIRATRFSTTQASRIHFRAASKFCRSQASLPRQFARARAHAPRAPRHALCGRRMRSGWLSRRRLRRFSGSSCRHRRENGMHLPEGGRAVAFPGVLEVTPANLPSSEVAQQLLKRCPGCFGAT